MHNNKTEKNFRQGFILSILLHLLLLAFCIASAIHFQVKTKQQKPPHYYVPAYTYTGAIQPSVAKTETSNNSEKAAEKNDQKNLPTEKNGVFNKSVLALSRQVIQQESIQSAVKNLKNSEPILLIGDEHQVADPLIRLVGRSLSAHFKYPEVEGRLGMNARVLIGMTLHPEGYFSDIEVLKSSNNQNFDSAALYAINSAPRVVGANKFISEPKYIVIGFVFRTY
jgi:TonB family protein